MCAGAIVLAASRPSSTGPGSEGGSRRQRPRRPRRAALNHRPEVIAGVRAEECATLLREFFNARRS